MGIGKALCASVIGGLAAVASAAQGNMWVHLSTRGLVDDKDMHFASNVIVRAAKAGMKEVVWPGAIETYWTWSAERKARMAEIRRIADANGIGIVPLIWSVGYGTMCGVEPGLIESVHMPALPYVAKGGRLVPDASDANLLRNGGFEDAGAGKGTPAAWGVDEPGVVAHRDAKIFRTGGASIRMEPGRITDKYPHARLRQHVTLKPGRFYRATVWLRTEGFDTMSGRLKMQIYLDRTSINGGADACREVRDVAPWDGWRKFELEFPSRECSGATVWCGTWGAKSGTFWVDDVSVEEIALREVSRSADSPRTVRSASTGKAYAFGKDWTNPDWAKKRRNEPVMFPLPAGSAIAEGEKVLLDTYIPGRAGPKMQISTCMSDPRLYQLFRKSAEALEELLHPKKWFLSLDEVRNGGTCHLCAARKTDMAHIFADCILRQHEIIRSVHPGAEIYAWSDMFDPYHNSHDNYCGCKGTFAGVCDLIPRDVTMVLWHGGVLDKTIPFFTEHGLKVMGSVCCDGFSEDKTPDAWRKWKKAINETPGSKGFMYTTWRGDFSRLEDFAKAMLSE